MQGSLPLKEAWEPGTLLPSLRLRQQVATRQDRAPVVIRQSRPTSAARFEYEHPDEGDDPREDRFVMRDTTLAGRIAEEVEKAYPTAYLFFRIEIESEQGVIQIRLQGLMSKQSYICHVADVETDPKCTQVITGCGELLERYGFSRTNLDRDDVRAAMDTYPLWRRPNAEVPGGNYQNKRW